MCTVTYLPVRNNGFILTSSRDVPFAREQALHPKKYNEDDVEITYPKDGRAGGTWIGTSSKKRLICLLNGGFENHYLTTDLNIKYRKSRGIIVLDLLKESEINIALTDIDLDKIEPFTLVIVDWNEGLELLELVWDGTEKHIKRMSQENHIWSSSTLYDDEMKQLRRDWFENWELHQKRTDILNFHHTAGIGNESLDVLMKREKVGTVSITQVAKIDGKITMNYESVF